MSSCRECVYSVSDCNGISLCVCVCVCVFIMYIVFFICYNLYCIESMLC